MLWPWYHVILRIDELPVHIEIETRCCKAGIDLAGTTLVRQPIRGCEEIECPQLELVPPLQVLVDFPNEQLLVVSSGI